MVMWYNTCVLILLLKSLFLSYDSSLNEKNSGQLYTGVESTLGVQFKQTLHLHVLDMLAIKKLQFYSEAKAKIIIKKKQTKNQNMA